MKARGWSRVVNGGQKFKDYTGEGYIYRGKRFYLVKYGPTITGPHFKEPEAQTERGE
jgi:hypothetical protein